MTYQFPPKNVYLTPTISCPIPPSPTMGGMEMSNESRYTSSNGITTLIEQVLFSNQELSFFDVMSSRITDNVTELYSEDIPEKTGIIFNNHETRSYCGVE